MLTLAAKQGNDFFVAVPELEKALGWRADGGREKFESKSLKAFAGKDLGVGKKSIKYGQYTGQINVISTKDFSVVITWAAINGNTKAQSLVAATWYQGDC